MSDEELRIDEFGTIIEPVLDDCELYRLTYYPVPDPPSKKVPKYKPLSPLPLPQEKSDPDNDDVVWVCSKLTSDNTNSFNTPWVACFLIDGVIMVRPDPGSDAAKVIWSDRTVC